MTTFSPSMRKKKKGLNQRNLLLYLRSEDTLTMGFNGLCSSEEMRTRISEIETSTPFFSIIFHGYWLFLKSVIDSINSLGLVPFKSWWNCEFCHYGGKHSFKRNSNVTQVHSKSIEFQKFSLRILNLSHPV